MSGVNKLDQGKITLEGLTALINLKKEDNSYNKLEKNTEEYLKYEFKKHNTNTERREAKNKAKIIKNSFMKYLKILRYLYEYNIHYENLLKKYGEEYGNELQLLKKTNIKDKNGIELNSKGIRDKIFKMLVRQKQKGIKLFNKMTAIISGPFLNFEEKNYETLARTFSNNKQFPAINFNETPKNKEAYLKKIRAWVSEHGNRSKLSKNIDINIKNSIKDLISLKKRINSLYINLEENANNANEATGAIRENGANGATRATRANANNANGETRANANNGTGATRANANNANRAKGKNNANN
jgi:hypothetical protein